MVGGDGWRGLLGTSAGSEISIRGAHEELAAEDAGDEDQERCSAAAADVPGCLFPHSLSSLPLRRHAHLLLFSPTVSNVTTIQSKARRHTNGPFPRPAFKIKSFMGAAAYICM